VRAERVGAVGRRVAAILLVLICGAGPAAAASTLRIGNGQEPETLDPHRGEGVSTLNILRDLYEGLMSVAPDGRVVAGAAREWTVSADGRVYTFTLHQDGRWSDGTPVTAADFVAGLRRSVDPATGSSFAGILSPIVNADAVVAGDLPVDALGVTALDPHTLQIRLNAPTAHFLGLLSHPSTFPIHPPSLRQWGAAFARTGRLVSNGAYRLREWAVQAQVALERNPHYRDAANVAIDRVLYYPTEDLQSELKRYRAGELDVTFQIPLVQAPWIRERYGDQLRIATYLGVYYYGFNLTRPPFKDNRDLREALAMVVDRELIVDKLMNGLARPATGWVPPGLQGYAPQAPRWAQWTWEQRLAEARRLYARAGYSTEKPLEVEIRYNTHEDHRRIAVVIAAMWKQHLGVRTRLFNEEGKVFVNNRRARRVTQVFRASWIGDYDDVSTFTDILQSRSGQNDTGWSDAEYDTLLAQAAATADPVLRQALLRRAEARILDQWPVIPIYWYVSKHLVSPRVENWQDNILDYHYSKDLRLKPSMPR
jgi:oligopeptide transport system substrate-binding protein